MEIFDTHCHPQLEQYNEDRDSVLERAKNAGVFMICIGTDYETSREGIELAQKNDGMWATAGLHPNDNLGEKFDSGIYEKLLKMDKVVGMGEVGLDYYWTPDPKDQNIQKKRFEEQLDLAVRMSIPLILHSRDAGKGSSGKVHIDMTEMLLDFQPTKAGVAHSFTGGIEEARKYLDLGFCLGFNGIVSFARQYDSVVQYVPLDRILLETDAPFLAPEPFRGKRNEPMHVTEVAKKIAEIRNESIDRVIAQTTENCRKLFNLV